MSERRDLLVSIANEIKTYREGEIAQPTPEHVDRWASQFTPANQVAFLREFNHVIKQTFITKDNFVQFLDGLLTNTALAGSNPGVYWANANFLKIQRRGQSQKQMVSLMGERLAERLGLDITRSGSPQGEFIYLDDVLFTGGRISTDLTAWIEGPAPNNAVVKVITIALHTSGHYYIESRKLREAIARSGKNIRITFWRLFNFENRLYSKNTSDVLWPTSIPNDAAVQAYVATQQVQLRTAGNLGTLGIFSSEAGRNLLEQEFLIAGVKIRSLAQNLLDFYRPLGCGSFGVGFGSTIVTHRNCPNNCPLAMWWGNPDDDSGALHWYPLFQRKTYASAENVFNDFDEL
ncbi:phosphoribosyltransferase-like protein [Stenotrophomonas nitritireducens]|uniref:phosphoribosyltransferase-like protein n=1 Tax=Stenotrophomonas nitritireducens TaxID=83617 RepID=UPI0009EA6569|nr:hypothetical protein [Stenotrophomonas nitritireducens]